VPTIFINGYKFRFYSSDIYEPPHMHVIRENKEAKIWLQPVQIEHNHGYRDHELSRILKLTQKNLAKLRETWNDYFSQ